MMDKWIALIYTFFIILGLGISLSRHGQERKVKDNFLFDLCVISILLYAFWWGGFYDGWLK